MSDQRHNFTQKTTRKLCDRVGAVCSNPECRAPTKGPHSDGEKSVSVGMACHIHAAAPGGPRYDPDEDRFPAPLLRSWRADAELAAFKTIGKPAAAATAPSDGIPFSDGAAEIMRWLAEQHA